MTTASVLVLNSGSSSVKFAHLDPETGARQLTGTAERVGTPDAVLRLDGRGGSREVAPEDTSYPGVIGLVLDEVQRGGGDLPRAVGHRVVHGGRRSASVVVDDDVLDEIRSLTGLAPLHLPANVAGIEAAREVVPDVPQVAVFDTAYHQTMPPRAHRYAVPATWHDDLGVRRYGFHGTSHRYVSARAADMLGRPLEQLRMVTAHLGNGCSATAVRDGVSVDTTMGLTPLEGLVMGTRSGDVDAGVLGYVAGRTGEDLDALLDTLNTKSGLLGLSGVSNDVRTVTEAAQAGSPEAALALDVFTYRLAKYVAALVVPLERLDALVLTGGVGENSVLVRRAVLSHLGFLGLAEDPQANALHGRDTGGRISVPGPVQALVVPTDEEIVIARDAARLAAGGAGDLA